MTRSPDEATTMRLLTACVARWARAPTASTTPVMLPHAAGMRSSLVSSARKHGVVGPVHLCLVECFGESATDLERDYLRDVVHHLRAIAALDEVAEALDSHGIPWVTFKGPVLAGHVYPRPDLRSYRDLDILVVASDLPETVTVLARHGYTIADRNWDLFHREERGEVHLVAQGRPPVDLHWHPVNWGGARRGLAIEPGAWIRRARRVTVHGRDVPTLDCTDTVVHLGLHAALSGAHLLRWLQDVHHVVESQAVRWDEVITRAHDGGAHVGLAVVLRRTARLLGTSVPDGVLESLDPSRARATISSLVDERWSRDSEVAGLVAATWAKTLRRSWFDTALTAVHRTWRGGRYRFARSRAPNRRPIQSRHTGGPAAQSEFLAAVAGSRGRR